MSSAKPNQTRRPAQRSAGNSRSAGTSTASRQTARQRLAEERAAAAAAREAAERKRKIAMAFVPVVVVLALVVALVVVKVVLNSGPKSGAKAKAATAAVLADVAGVPTATSNSVGAGTIKTVPQTLKGGTLLTSGGKPKVLYVGAEYCPYCAAERWAVAVALSRFGTLKGVGETTSAPKPEVYPSTSTLSFHGGSLTSSSISFSAYETASNQVKNGAYTKLDSLPSADQALLSKYDAPPYVSTANAGSIPFVLIGGKYMVSGASYDPSVLSGKSHAQIAAALKDPNSAISKGAVGTANVITAAICATLTTKPAVCSSAGVAAGMKKLTGGK